jgi:hypothetical protein
MASAARRVLIASMRLSGTGLLHTMLLAQFDPALSWNDLD